MAERIDSTMDIFYLRKNSRTGRIVIAGAAAAAGCVLMILFPAVALDSARKGISLWLTNVLPALLPFFICANFLQNLGIMKCFSPGMLPFTMSVLSGYPMGAKIIGDMKRAGDIGTGEAKRLISFCSTSGPAFMVGAVGAGMLGSGLAGGIIAVSHYAGALINGAVYSHGYRTRRKVEAGYCRDHIVPGAGIQESLTDSITSSFRALGIILAYIVIFMFVTDMLHMSGLLSLVGNQSVRALVKGFFEMTVGCGAAAECRMLSDAAKCVMCTAVMSWGGLSVLGQSMSMLSGCGVPAGYLVRTKLTHCIFSTATALILSAVML